jgi:hypothetical protein
VRCHESGKHESRIRKSARRFPRSGGTIRSWTRFALIDVKKRVVLQDSNGANRANEPFVNGPATTPEK